LHSVTVARTSGHAGWSALMLGFKDLAARTASRFYVEFSHNLDCRIGKRNFRKPIFQTEHKHLHRRILHETCAGRVPHSSVLCLSGMWKAGCHASLLRHGMK
jgi:hypothetical protein